jgi:LPS-assembly protein
MAATGMTRIRHMVTPAIGYSFIQDKGQDRLPFFDYDDRVLGQNLVNWSLTNLLTGRFQSEGTEYRELLMMRISQGYQLSGERRDLLNGADSHEKVTDLRLEAVANPIKALAIDLDSRFSTNRGKVTTTSLGARLNDNHGNSVGMGYRRTADIADYLQGMVSIALLKPLYLNLTERYSFDRHDFLEQYYAVEYRHQCWSVTVSYRDRPGNSEFLVNFSLAGIGNIGKVN